MERSISKKCDPSWLKQAAFLFPALLAFAVLGTGCTSKKEEGKVQIAFPFIPQDGLQKNTPATSGTKISTQATTSSGGSAPNWGFGSMASLSDVNCFAVFVRVPETSPATRTCYNTAKAEVVKYDLWKAGFTPGETTSIIVPAGANREFHVVGIKALNNAACRTLSQEDIDHSQFSRPMVIGSTTADVRSGNNELTILTAFNPAKEIDDCPNNQNNTPPVTPPYAINGDCPLEVQTASSSAACSFAIPLATTTDDVVYATTPNHTCGGTLAINPDKTANYNLNVPSSPAVCFVSLVATIRGQSLRYEETLAFYCPLSVSPLYSG
ncbi:MAG: hypothetical protein RBT63_04815, partial [Bdellovibrionales bacterium]|nr:hypothetical protein [Bdellovibrionales bacterium]